MSEFLLAFPLWVVAWAGLWQWHQRVNDGFEIRRAVGTLCSAPVPASSPAALLSAPLQHRVRAIDMHHGPSTTSGRAQGPTPAGLPLPDSLPLSGTGLEALLEPLLTKRQVRIAVEGNGLWPQQEARGVMLVPGPARPRLFYWSLAYGLAAGL